MIESIDYIRIISEPAKSEFKEKRSRFLGFAHHVQSEDEATDVLHHYQKQYFDATHHCFAWQINQSQFRYSDAGEPSGTAGIPIYNAIKHFQLQEVMVIVVRYFGGIKLGTGGLTRAYNHSAMLTLKQARIVEKKLWEVLRVELDYTHVNTLMNTLNMLGCKPLDLNYDSSVHGTIAVLPSQKQSVIDRLTELSAGRIQIVQPENSNHD